MSNSTVPTPYFTWLGVLSLVEFSLGTPLNLLCVWYFLGRSSARSGVNCLFVAISSVDFLMCVIMGLTVVYSFSADHTDHGPFSSTFLCNVWGVAWHYGAGLSVFLVAVLSVTRWKCMVYPLKKIKRGVLPGLIIGYSVFQMFKATMNFWYNGGEDYQFSEYIMGCTVSMIKPHDITKLDKLLYFLFYICEILVPTVPIVGFSLATFFTLYWSERKLNRDDSDKSNKGKSREVILDSSSKDKETSKQNNQEGLGNQKRKFSETNLDNSESKEKDLESSDKTRTPEDEVGTSKRMPKESSVNNNDIENRSAGHNNPDNSKTNGGSRHTNQGSTGKDKKKSSKWQRKRHATITILLLVLVYVVCNVWFWGFLLVDAVYIYSDGKMNYVKEIWGTDLMGFRMTYGAIYTHTAVLNSTTNAFIYFIRLRGLRRFASQKVGEGCRRLSLLWRRIILVWNRVKPACGRRGISRDQEEMGREMAERVETGGMRRN